jgi:tetratricopeptide (TPR) repeat protein
MLNSIQIDHHPVVDQHPIVDHCPIGHYNQGRTHQLRGHKEEAVASYRKALQLNPEDAVARRELAMLLAQLGRRNESAFLFYEEMLTNAECGDWMTALVTEAMKSRNLYLAGEYAAILADLRSASTLYPARRNGSLPPLPVQSPPVFLSIGKLQHDIEQFRYLQDRGILGEEFTAIIKDYQNVMERLIARGTNERIPPDSEAERTIGHIYNRIVHLRETPRVHQPFSADWDPDSIERQYLEPGPGIVVIDNFLSAEALENVRLFCLESTMWSGNRYAHGRLGAFLHDGFNCPLLLQIAEELRNSLPNVIGDRYPLRQLWGFKNSHHLPGDSSTHADFAAVNVNFWVTPDDANLDDTCGGLDIFTVDAPLEWDFRTYNGRPDLIASFLQMQNAKKITVPYRQNRAIIFNSDLFHGTSEVKFRRGYENRRINITMLYGEREDDVHHQELSRRDAIKGSTASTWRSGAFGQSRRGKR